MVACVAASSGGGAAEDRLPALVGADVLHEAGVTGRGITVAMIGGEAAPAADVRRAGDGHDRLLAVFDAVSAAGREEPRAPIDGLEGAAADGLLAAMLSSRLDAQGRWQGIAPNADLILVRALGADGTGRPADVVRAVQWVVANRDRYGIRVLNLPLATPARSPFWAGALNQAVIEAWRAGIVVVVAAGNGGPAPASVSAPGDLPQVITVGAVTASPEGEAVPGYSAAGPTLDGFVKPEIVAPTDRAQATAAPASAGTIGRLSGGTAVSSAVVAGVVALVLEANPWLTPEEVKQRLLSSARPAMAPSGEGYSIFRQGAGVIDALAAADGATPVGAERRLAARGMIWWDGALRGMTWSDSALRGMTWSDSALRGMTWSDSALRGMTWSDSALRGMTWSDSALESITWPDRALRGMTWSD